MGSRKNHFVLNVVMTMLSHLKSSCMFCYYNLTWSEMFIRTVICSMRTALVASVSCRRPFMCSMLRLAVLSFSISSPLVGSTVHTKGSGDATSHIKRFCIKNRQSNIKVHLR